jgi:hypothetical protein
MRGISPGGSYFPAKAELISIRLSHQFDDELTTRDAAVHRETGRSPNWWLRRIRGLFCLQSFA